MQAGRAWRDTEQAPRVSTAAEVAVLRYYIDIKLKSHNGTGLRL